jgi:hypothetical protein
VGRCGAMSDMIDAIADLAIELAPADDADLAAMIAAWRAGDFAAVAMPYLVGDEHVPPLLFALWQRLRALPGMVPDHACLVSDVIAHAAAARIEEDSYERYLHVSGARSDLTLARLSANGELVAAETAAYHAREMDIDIDVARRVGAVQVVALVREQADRWARDEELHIARESWRADYAARIRHDAEKHVARIVAATEEGR